MEKKFESWSMGHGDVAIYTEDPELAKEIRKLVGRGSTYERAGKVFVWQFMLPQTKKRFVEKKIFKKYAVDSKAVTESQNSKFNVTDIQKVEGDNCHVGSFVNFLDKRE